MKAKKWLILALSMVLAVATALGIAACGETTSNNDHTHTYDTWDYDVTQHWKYCDEHGEDKSHIDETSRENHKFDPATGKCECGYTDPNFNAGGDEVDHSKDTWAWKDNKDGTHTGTASCGDPEHNVTNEAHIWGADNKCTKCGADKPADEHTHTFTWKDNGDGTHTGTASCGDPEHNVTNEAHIWGADNKCTKCGADKPADEHTHTPSDYFVHNETQHWKVCTDDGEVIDATKAKHNLVKQADGTFKCECGHTMSKWTEEDATNHTRKSACTGEHVEHEAIAERNPHNFGTGNTCADCGFTKAAATQYVYLIGNVANATFDFGHLVAFTPVTGGKFQLTITLFAGEQFKIINSATENPDDWPADELQYDFYDLAGDAATDENFTHPETGAWNIVVVNDGTYTFTVDPSVANGKGLITYTYKAVQWDLYYLGGANSWTKNEQYKLTTADDGETYTVKVNVQAGEQFKIVNYTNNLVKYFDDPAADKANTDKNYIIAEAGEYTVTFTAATKAITVETAHEHKWTWQSNAEEHWQSCTCGAVQNRAAHDKLTTGKDAEGHWQECATCGYKSQTESHTLTWQHNDQQHWKACSCGYIDESTRGEHKYIEGTCECGLKEDHEHDWKWKTSDTEHWQACDCGAEQNRAAHTGWTEWTSDGDTTHSRSTACTEHDAVKVTEDHKTTVETSATQHWTVCTECSYESAKTDHTYTYTDNKDGKHHTKKTSCEEHAPLSTVEEHNFVGGKCVCGAAEAIGGDTRVFYVVGSVVDGYWHKEGTHLPLQLKKTAEYTYEIALTLYKGEQFTIVGFATAPTAEPENLYAIQAAWDDIQANVTDAQFAAGGTYMTDIVVQKEGVYTITLYTNDTNHNEDKDGFSIVATRDDDIAWDLYIFGSMNVPQPTGWTQDENFRMTKGAGTTYTKTFTTTKAKEEFKVVNVADSGNRFFDEGDGTNIVLETAGEYTVTFDTATYKVTVQKKGDQPVTYEDQRTYFLVGGGTGDISKSNWALNVADLRFTRVSDHNYELKNIKIMQGDQIKLGFNPTVFNAGSTQYVYGSYFFVKNNAGMFSSSSTAWNDNAVVASGKSGYYNITLQTSGKLTSTTGIADGQIVNFKFTLVKNIEIGETHTEYRVVGGMTNNWDVAKGIVMTTTDNNVYTANVTVTSTSGELAQFKIVTCEVSSEGLLISQEWDHITASNQVLPSIGTFKITFTKSTNKVSWQKVS